MTDKTKAEISNVLEDMEGFPKLTVNEALSKIITIVEAENKGEVVMGSITNGVLKIPQSIVRELMSENGQVIFRPEEK